LVDPAVTTITVSHMVPDWRAGVRDSPVVLGPSQKPPPRVGIAGQVLNLADAEALVQRSPRVPGVGRPEDTAIITRVEDVGIAGREGQAVLVGVDAIAGPCRDVRPLPRGATQRAPEGIDGADEDPGGVVRRGRHVPIVLRLP